MAVPSEHGVILGASGLDAELLALCQNVLSEVAVIEPLPEDGLSLPSTAWAALLIGLERPLAESMVRFSRLRQAYPLLPLLVLAEDVDGNFAAELLKCGAEDFLMLPPTPSALLHKVRRMLGES